MWHPIDPIKRYDVDALILQMLQTLAPYYSKTEVHSDVASDVDTLILLQVRTVS